MRILTRLIIIENNQLNMRKVTRILLQVPTLIIQTQTQTLTLTLIQIQIQTQIRTQK